MRALGAKVILTPAAERGTGMVRKAEELANNTAGSWHGSSRTRQTRPITQAPPGQRSCATSRGQLDYWVTGWGTGGTLSGAGRT